MEPHDSPRCSSQKSGSPGGLHLPYPHTQTFSQDDPGEWGALFLMSVPCVSSMRKCFEVQVASTTSFGPWCIPFGICIHLDEGQCGVPVLESIALCSLHALPFTNASQSATLISTPSFRFSKDPNLSCMTQDHCSSLSPKCHSGLSPASHPSMIFPKLPWRLYHRRIEYWN